MSTHPARPAAAASAADVRSGSCRRRPQSSSVAALERLSSRLDYLIRDVGLGATSQRQVEAMVDEAEAIATGIRALFREPTPAVPQCPPLRHEGGSAIW